MGSDNSQYVNSTFKELGRGMFPPPKQRPVFYRIERIEQGKRVPLGQWVRRDGVIEFYDCRSKQYFPGPMNNKDSAGYEREGVLRRMASGSMFDSLKGLE